MKRIQQFRYYGVNSPKNSLDGDSNSHTKSQFIAGSIFPNPILQLGIQSLPGTKFYVNGKTHLKGDTRITGNLLMTTGGSSIYWDDGTCRQRIINTDDSTANTAVFNFQQSSIY